MAPTRLVSLVAILVAGTVSHTAAQSPLYHSRQLQDDASGSDDATGATNFTMRLLHHVNLVRVGARVTPLCLNSKLVAAAKRHANDMAKHDFVRNEGSDASSLMDRLSDEGFNYTAIGETIAAGHATARRVVRAWNQSTWHRSILISDQYTFFGGAHAYNGDGTHVHYWVQDFAGAEDGEACDDDDDASTA